VVYESEKERSKKRSNEGCYVVPPNGENGNQGGKKETMGFGYGFCVWGMWVVSEQGGTGGGEAGTLDAVRSLASKVEGKLNFGVKQKKRLMCSLTVG